MADPAAHLPAFVDAQRRTLDLLRDLVPRLEAGMSERDVHELAHSRGSDLGFQSWFRAPVVRFGAPPDVRWTDRPRRKPLLEIGTTVELEVAPATGDAFGDAGIALCFGVDKQPEIVDDARELCRAIVGFASRWKCVGELFVFAEAWANNHSGSLGGQRSVGFVAMTPDRSWAGRWPGGAWAASLLRRNQVQFFNPRRMSGIYVLRPRMVANGQGASFAEMILVTPDSKQIIGRDSLDEVGRL